uniref:HEPN domain-containing protein n=1 Tax=Heterorhabditis bacteriophora TaxID=37862 RepID=A0A1I7XUR5_HETBA
MVQGGFKQHAYISIANCYVIYANLPELTIGYPNMFALLYDLQLMAESHCTYNRSPTIRRDILIAAEAIYRASI